METPAKTPVSLGADSLEAAPPPAPAGPSESHAEPVRSASPPPASIMTSNEGGSTSSDTSTSVALAAPVWTHRVSASFNAMAEQIAAASQAIAMIPPLPDGMFAALSERIEGVERTQGRLERELEALRGEMAGRGEGPERFENALKEVQEAFRLEQQRLPGRLHNAMVTVSKVGIKALPMANGKLPQNFPATRGEFEHLTKERYEVLLKCYGQPITGDTAAKREAVRVFIGLPQV